MELEAGVRDSLEEALAEATGERAKIVSVEAVGGGCIHRAQRIETARGAWFVKLNDADHEPMFAAEADGLAAIADAGAVRVPKVVAHGVGEDHAYLILEWLALAALDAPSAATLGVALANQHRATGERFGWHRDNFIGASPQANDPDEDWVRFWRGQRLHAQLRLAARNKLPSRMIDRGERLAADCHVLLANHAVVPSLLHGDLWGGNAAALEGGTPALFDPAAYHGDREADLAMTELFGGFPADFKAAYRNAWPLDDGYSVRRDFYNLYHVLNHANLFAGDYVRDSERRIERLLAEIS